MQSTLTTSDMLNYNLMGISLLNSKQEYLYSKVVSQANIGGAPTAIALAETFDRKELILPAILVGTLGNALGSYLGFFVVYVL